MPVYSSNQSIDNLRRRPDLPDLPVDDDRILPYLAALDKAIVTFYDELSKRLQSYTILTMLVSFGAADTSVAVAFASPLEDDEYVPTLTPSWDTRIWVTGLTVAGFVINTSSAPGGAGGTVRVTVAR